MNKQDVLSLLAAFDQSDARDFELVDGEFKLHLSKNKLTDTRAATPAATVANVGQASVSDEKELNPPAVSSSDTPNGVEIKAPLVGVVYVAPKPDAAPYVQVGDHVAVGQVVAMVEAMKMMTEIKTDVAGQVVKVMMNNETMVDYDQPLIEVIPDKE